MKNISLFILVLSATMMISCGGGDGTTNNLVKKLNSSYENDGKEVTLVCYPTIAEHSLTLIDRSGTIPIYLRNSKWQKSQDAFVITKLNFGKEPNCLWLPEKYTLGDVEIFDSEGNNHGTNTKLAIKGIVRYTNKDWEKATIAKEESSGGIRIVGAKSATERAEEAKKKAEERRKKTGDPNDYSFIFEVTSISVAK